MTDCDPGLAALRDHTYGGPPVPVAPLVAALRRLGLRLPCQVIAVQHGDQPEPPMPRGGRVRALRLHNGLAYWCAMRDPAPVLAHLDRLGVLHGGALPCAAPERLLVAIREAVVDMRRRELAGSRRGGPGTPDAASELQLRSLVVHQVSSGHPAWPDHVKLWTAVAVVRHQRSLNNLRRRMVEVLALLTRDHDLKNLGFAFARALERIYACFTYTGLERLFPELVAELVAQLDPPGPGDLRRAQSSAVRRAADCVRTRFREPISLTDVAAAAGVSAAHLARSFRREIGCAVGDSLRRLRLAEARRLLGDGPRTVLAVALDCGFNSVEHFHRVFRAEVGTSPDAWRRLAQAEEEGAPAAGPGRMRRR